MVEHQRHIVFVFETLERGGAELLRYALLRAQPKELRCSVVCLRALGSLGEQMQQEGMAVYALNGQTGFPSMRLLWRLRSLLRQLQADIVHTVMYEAHRHGVLAARLAGCPVFMEEHGFNEWMGRRERLYTHILSHFAYKILTVSQVQADTLRVLMFYPEKRLHIVPNCIDVDGFSKSFPKKVFTAHVLAVGNLSADKNYAFLLQMFAVVLSSMPQARLSIAGDGGLRAELEQLAVSLGVAHAVRFLGSVRDVPALLATADVYVHAGTNETFCIALAEAMFMSCACVAPNIGVFRVLGDAGRAVRLVAVDRVQPMADAVLALLHDQAARQSLGRAAHAFVEQHYLPQQHWQKMMILYDLCLQSRGHVCKT